MKDTAGESALQKAIPIGLLQSGDQNPGTDRAVVDKEGLQRAAGTGVGGAGHKAGDPVTLPLAVHGDHLTAGLAVNAVNGVLQPPCTGCGEDFLVLADKTEGDLRVGESLQLHCGGDLAALYGVGGHKGHTGGGVVKQIPHDDRGAVGTAGLGFLQDLTCL